MERRMAEEKSIPDKDLAEIKKALEKALFSDHPEKNLINRLKKLWTKVKENNKKYKEEKSWISQYRKKKRHSQSPTHDQPLEQGSGVIKKYAKGGGIRKARYK
tara:strand:- start:13 stop:321 length:309 start_codon:yes stop_codon:yes gene_type:complete